jgi:hypothetical protein
LRMVPSGRSDDGIWRSPLAEVVIPALETDGVSTVGIMIFLCSMPQVQELGMRMQATKQDRNAPGCLARECCANGSQKRFANGCLVYIDFALSMRFPCAVWRPRQSVEVCADGGVKTLRKL